METWLLDVSTVNPCLVTKNGWENFPSVSKNYSKPPTLKVHGGAIAFQIRKREIVTPGEITHSGFNDVGS